MYTETKSRLNIAVDSDVDQELRIAAVRHRASISHVVELALRHCLSDDHFLAKLEQSTQKSA